MEYSYLLDLADECEDPYMRLVYSSKDYSNLSLSLSLSLIDGLIVANCSIMGYICLLCIPTYLETIQSHTWWDLWNG